MFLILKFHRLDSSKPRTLGPSKRTINIQFLFWF